MFNSLWIRGFLLHLLEQPLRSIRPTVMTMCNPGGRGPTKVARFEPRSHLESRIRQWDGGGDLQ